MNEKNYPSTVCQTCGELALKKTNHNKKQFEVSTWYPGTCGWCGNETSPVTEPRDFCYPDFDLIPERRGVNRKIIIALSGKSKSGKDEFAKLLIEKYGAVKISFADKLKDVVCLMFGFDRDKMDDQEYKNQTHPVLGVSPREILQVFGTEVMRVSFPKILKKVTKATIKSTDDIWIHCALRDIEKMYEEGKRLFVITDLRFKNEYEAFKDIAYMIRVDRPGVPELTHISETDLDDVEGWNQRINNGGTLRMYKKKCKSVIKGILRNRPIPILCELNKDIKYSRIGLNIQGKTASVVIIDEGYKND